MAISPVINSTSPINYETDVAVNTSFRAEFNIDLDSRYIQDFVFMTNDKGERVDIRTAYRAKVITVTPLSSLQTGSTYQITFVGVSDREDGALGLRSIIGDGMIATEHSRLQPSIMLNLRRLSCFLPSMVQS
jgi:hypothetical protein